MHKKGMLLALTLLSCLFLTASYSWAANVQMSVSIGFKGYVLPGRWVPLQVEFKGAPKGGTIEVTRRSCPGLVERYPYATYANQSTRLEIPFYAEETGDIATVKLIANGQVLAEQHLRTYESIFLGHFILTLQTPVQIGKSIGISFSNEPINVIPVTSKELPAMILDYDSISGIVVAGSDFTLNPAQKRALRDWVAGGGRLFITPEAVAALGSEFLAPPYRQRAYGRVYTLGLGRIVCGESELSLLPWVNNPQLWREAFDIAPFAKSHRLTPSLFELTEHKKPLKQPVSPWYFLFPTLWGIVVLSVTILSTPKKRFALLLASTIIFTLAAIPFGRYQQSYWRRGATIHSHLLLLPNDEAIFQTQIQLPDAKIWDGRGIAASPWGVEIQSRGTDSGKLQPLFSRVEWNHRTVMPFCNVMTAHGDELNLVGCMSKNLLNETLQTVQNHLATVKYEEHQWYVTYSTNDGDEHWRRSRRMPGWLIPERVWVERATLTAPNGTWLLGKESIRSIGLSLQGGSHHQVIWMKLITGEAKP